ncbi:calcium-binding mitochondrial carrier protein SCaMC-2-like isoform X2 [Scyliorhinus canicula]|uniref:calcium-binding mitochondrial carrier protein SCaMC-2-like isoform X2 n=1 Tax=Scyliorhinus canicula TaxID=7830 RepID=UPI0018F3DBDF|nr:calcium-binding mitochondrial carrier protein SCaMC-2-like isoform X2 [Scyliorhinus canicula]
MFLFMKDIFQRAAADELSPINDLWEDLYWSLNVHRTGHIDAKELVLALEAISEGSLKDKKNVKSTKGKDFEGFRKYLEKHNMKLFLGFGKDSKDRSGNISRWRIMRLMRKLHVSLNLYHANRILKHLDENDYMDMDWNEWRKIYITTVEDNMRSMIDIWRFNSIFSINDDITNCEEFLENQEPEKWWGHLIAGGTAGGVSRTVTAPFDRLRVLMQIYSSRHNKMKISGGIRAMIKEGGVSSMWRGNLTNILKIGPELAFKFMAYEELKSAIAAEPENLGIKGRFLAGSMAGAFSQTATYPVEMLKTRMMLRKTGEPRELYAQISNIFKHEGISTFYRGYVPNILGIIPYAGIDLAVYETMKNLWIKRYTTGNERPNMLLVVGSATTSNVVGQLASYPLMLIHTRMQAEVIAKGMRKPRMREYFWNILDKDGLLGFYRGFTANLLKAVPSVCISYVLYEYLKTHLGLASH